MFNIILYQPEIPPNTGNIIRLCANTGASLHLIEPLGFDLTDNKQVKRSGLDYHDIASVRQYPSLNDCFLENDFKQVYAISTKGSVLYHEVEFHAGDALLFGPETRGLPESLLHNMVKNNILRIPMVSDSRSLNLSNSVAVVVYEAWRQLRFVKGA